ncbi:MAG: hypothetical protein ACFE0S_10275 [Rhodospirillales bacterium]
MNDQFLTDEILNAVPRALGLTNRQESKETYGCADRAYWHYCQIDFANARFQEAGLLLSYAWVTPVPGSPYYRNARVLNWIVGIWSWWLGARTADGAVAETYPNERSFCATAFSAASFIESTFLLRDAYNWRPMLQSAGSTMHWLATHENLDAANQIAASYKALAGYATLTGKDAHRTWAVQRRDTLLATMNDGVLPEYGDFDSGYQSLSLAEMSATERLFGSDPKIAAAKQDGLRALRDRFTVPAGFEPELNARRTQYLFPSGLIEAEDFLEDDIMPMIEAGRILRPGWMDDRYFIGLATDYLRLLCLRKGTIN